MKSSVIAIIAAGLLIGGAILLSRDTGSAPENNVSMVDGKQIVTITAKGKYAPGVSTAAAGVPTTIAVKTNGTFDCSSALTIPAIKYEAMLPPSGVTNIEIPAQEAGTSLQGRCAMGMYTFAINFN